MNAPKILEPYYSNESSSESSQELQNRLYRLERVCAILVKQNEALEARLSLVEDRLQSLAKTNKQVDLESAHKNWAAILGNITPVGSESLSFE